MSKEFALYIGDEFITIGTIRYISKSTGISERSLYHYRTKTYKKECRDQNTEYNKQKFMVELKGK